MSIASLQLFANMLKTIGEEASSATLLLGEQGYPSLAQHKHRAQDKHSI